MLDELTAEQQFELFHYHAIEPFGEVRDDLRMAKLIQFYYDAKRGKKGRRMSLADFVLYADMNEAAQENRSSEAALLNALGG